MPRRWRLGVGVGVMIVEGVVLSILIPVSRGKERRRLGDGVETVNNEAASPRSRFRLPAGKSSISKARRSFESGEESGEL